MRIHIETLGCRLNQSESDRLARDFVAIGHEIVPEARLADIQIVNTCAVTHKATRESRQAVRAGLRAAPSALTVITGCASEIEPGFFGGLEGRALVTGHSEKERLIPLMIERGILPQPDMHLDEAFPLPHTRTRAFVKIQDGCSNRCSYCVSRLARGEERSRPVAAIVREINHLVQEGFQEVVLTGLHAASYGRDLGTDLATLVRSILAQTRIARLRLSSLEPWGASDALLDLWSDSRLCRHLHLPLQSGCDRTLRRMRRGYNTRQYAARIEAARKRIPGVAISTDIIVGFPGETDADFDASAQFMSAMRFSQAHIFPFSARQGTEAAALSDQIGHAAKQARAHSMKRIADASALAFREGLWGQSLSVLWEDQRDGLWSGFADNYVRVFCQATADLHNRITTARIVGACTDGVAGCTA